MDLVRVRFVDQREVASYAASIASRAAPIALSSVVISVVIFSALAVVIGRASEADVTSDDSTAVPA